MWTWRTTMIGAAVLTVLGLAPLTPRAAAQEERDDDSVLFEKERPAQRRARPPRDPDKLRQHIEELRAEDPDDPRIERLEGILKRMESRGERPGRGAARGVARGKGRPRPPRYTEEQIKEFLDEHPELVEIFTAGQRGPRGPRRRVGRPALQEIMRAFEEEDSARGQLMIDSAQTQFRIRRSMRDYREAQRDGDVETAALTRIQVEDLVRKQVRLDHEIKGLELERLRERLKRQTRKHQQQSTELDDIAARRLTAVIEGRGRGEDKRRGEGRGRRRGRDLDPEDEGER